ncbi:hypothetical protein INT44_004640 [Umbelopsis vinacea]|uniref:ASCH domain-containing protein n=1 Tax=Umbelopsis vinacea TaxID=44442 RepID=A0A8H7QBJ2_9FUNG|nr:hypothetical protein INT44_004640 [Umbelopsis vinacea]
MVSTRKRTRNDETPEVKKESLIKNEEKRVKTAPVKIKKEDSSADFPDTTLNGLTVQQPFASAIIFGPKRIECRKQPLKIKNPKEGRWLAIHCGKSKTNFTDKTYELTKKLRWTEVPSEQELMKTAGQIIGLAHFTATCPLDEISNDNVWKGAESCNNRTHAWSIDKVIPLDKPIAHTGQLGLWKVKEDIAKGLLKLID